jgi:hypothetical protein
MPSPVKSTLRHTLGELSYSDRGDGLCVRDWRGDITYFVVPNSNVAQSTESFSMRIICMMDPKDCFALLELHSLAKCVPLLDQAILLEVPCNSY